MSVVETHEGGRPVSVRTGKPDCSKAAYIREATSRLAAHRVTLARALAAARRTAALEGLESNGPVASTRRRLDRKLRSMQQRVDRVMAARQTTWRRHSVVLEEAFDDLAAEQANIGRLGQPG